MGESNRWNNYAISTADLASSLTKSSASLVAAGGDLAEAAALTATANAIIQDADAVGTALKTTSLRLRGTDAKVLEEEGVDSEGAVASKSKLQSKVKALSGVDILTEAGDYKSTYQILSQIADVWEDINNMDQAALLELLAGKRNASVLAAILQSPEELKAAYEDAQNAEGSALEENEKYMDSIQGKIDQFNNALQTMWKNLLDDDVVKFFVDLGKQLVVLLDKIGPLNALFIGFGVFAAKKYNLLDNLFGEPDSIEKSIEKLQKQREKLDGLTGTKAANQRDAIDLQIKEKQAILDQKRAAAANAAAAAEAKDAAATSAGTVVDSTATKVTTQKTAATWADVWAEMTREGATMGSVAATIQQVLATKLLNTAYVQNLITTGQLTAAEVTNMSITKLLGLGFKGLAVGIGKATASMLKFLFTTPVGWFILAASAVALLGAKFAQMHVSADEASEKLKETKEAISGLESELDGLKSELDEAKEKLAELLALPYLSITQQEEVDRLERTIELLEREIALRERELALKEQQMITDAEETMKKKFSNKGNNYYQVGSDGIIKKDTPYGGIGKSGDQAVEAAIKRYEDKQKAIDQAYEILDDWGDKKTKSHGSFPTSVIEELNLPGLFTFSQVTKEDFIEGIKNAEADSVAIEQSVNDFFSDADYQFTYGMSDELDEYRRQLDNLQLKWDKTVYGEASKVDAFDSMFGAGATEEMQNLKKEIDKIMEAEGNWASDDEKWAAKNDAIQTLINSIDTTKNGYEQLDWTLKEFGATAKDIADYFTIMNGAFDSDTISGLAKQYAKGIEVMKRFAAMSDPEARDKYVKENLFGRKSTTTKQNNIIEQIKVDKKQTNIKKQAEEKAKAEKEQTKSFEEQVKARQEKFNETLIPAPTKKQAEAEKKIEKETDKQTKIQVDAAKEVTKRVKSEAKAVAQNEKTPVKAEEKTQKDEKSKADKAREEAERAAKAKAKEEKKARERAEKEAKEKAKAEEKARKEEEAKKKAEKEKAKAEEKILKEQEKQTKIQVDAAKEITSKVEAESKGSLSDAAKIGIGVAGASVLATLAPEVIPTLAAGAAIKAAMESADKKVVEGVESATEEAAEKTVENVEKTLDDTAESWHIKAGTYMGDVERPNYEGRMQNDANTFLDLVSEEYGGTLKDGATACVKSARAIANDLMYKATGYMDAFSEKYLHVDPNYAHGAKTFASELWAEWGEALGLDGGLPLVQSEQGAKIDDYFLQPGTLFTWAKGGGTSKTMTGEKYGTNYYGHAGVITDTEYSEEYGELLITYADDLHDTVVTVTQTEFEKMGQITHAVTQEMAAINKAQSTNIFGRVFRTSNAGIPKEIKEWATNPDAVPNYEDIKGDGFFDKLTRDSDWDGDLESGDDFKSFIKALPHNIEHVAKQHFTTGKTNKRDQAIDFFKNKGLSDKVVGAIVGNLENEGRWDTDLYTSTGEVYGGIAQLRGDRLKSLIDQYGINASFEDQLNFIWSELQGDYAEVLSEMEASELAGGNVVDLGEIFSAKYEQPDKTMLWWREGTIKSVYNDVIDENEGVFDNFLAAFTKNIDESVDSAAELTPEQVAATQKVADAQLKQTKEIANDTLAKQEDDGWWDKVVDFLGPMEVSAAELTDEEKANITDSVDSKQQQAQEITEASLDKTIGTIIDPFKIMVSDELTDEEKADIINNIGNKQSEAKQAAEDELEDWYNTSDDATKNIVYTLGLQTDTSEWDLDQWKQEVENVTNGTSEYLGSLEDFFTIDTDGKFKAKADEFAKVLKGMDNDSREAFIKIVENAANSAENLSQIDWDKAMAEFSLDGLHRSFDKTNEYWENENNDMFSSIADEINGLIDTAGELTAALDSVVGSMELVRKAQEQMSNSGRVSVKTALEIMQATEDWDKVLNITEDSITLLDGAEDVLIQSQLDHIKVQTAEAVKFADAQYEAALLAAGITELEHEEMMLNNTQDTVNQTINSGTQQMAGYTASTDNAVDAEYEHANSKVEVMTADAAKSKAIGVLAAHLNLVADTVAAIMGKMDWSKVGSNYTQTLANVYANADAAMTDLDTYRRTRDNRRDINDAMQQVDSVEGLRDYYDYDKTPGDKYDDSGDGETAFEKMQARHEREIATLEHQQELIQGDIDILEAQRKGVSSEYYKKLIDGENSKIDAYERQLAEAKELLASTSDTDEEYNDIVQHIWDIEKSLQDTTVAAIEFGEAMNDNFLKGVTDLGDAYDNLYTIIDRQKGSMDLYKDGVEIGGGYVNERWYDDMIAKAKEAGELANQELTDSLNAIDLWRNKANPFEEGTAEFEAFEYDRNTKLQEAWAQAADAKDKIQETNNEALQLAEDKKDAYIEAWENVVTGFERIGTLFENQISLIDGYESRLEALNINVPDSVYDKKAETQQDIIDNLDKEIAYDQQMLEEYATKYGTDDERYLSKREELDGKLVERYEAQTQLIEIEQQIIDNQIDRFNQIIDRMNDAVDKMNNIKNLVSDEDVANEDGTWTAEGLTQAGMNFQEMAYQKETIAAISDEMEELTKLYEEGKISEKEYYEQMNELEDKQWQAIDAYKAVEDAIVDLAEARIDAIENGLQEEIDAYAELIELKKEELDAERDLFEFRRDVEDQSKDIAEIERRMASISNSSSAEDRAEYKRLEKELYEANRGLDDTYRNHSYDQTSQALDEELETFEKNYEDYIQGLRDEIENTDELIKQVYADVVSNGQLVLETLVQLSDEHGFTLDENLTYPWKNANGESLNFETAATIHYTNVKNTVEYGTAGFVDNITKPWKRGQEESALFGTKAKAVVDQALLDAQNKQSAMSTALKQPWLDAKGLIDQGPTWVSAAAFNILQVVKQNVKDINDEYAKITNVGAQLSGNIVTGGGGGGNEIPQTTYNPGSYVPKETKKEETKKEETKKVKKTSGTLSKVNYTVSGQSWISWGADDFTVTLNGTTYKAQSNIYANGHPQDAKIQALFGGKRQAAGTLAMLNSKLYIVDKYGAWADVRTTKDGEKLRKAFYNKLGYHAKGTTGTTKDQWAITDEPQYGDELVLVPNAAGNLSFMRKGTGVVPADLTKRIMEIAQMPASELGNNIIKAVIPNIETNTNAVSVNFEALVKADNITNDVLPEVEKLVEKQLNTFTRNLNYSLKKVGGR